MPLVFFPYTSETFEFNKSLVLYTSASLLLGVFAWTIFSDRHHYSVFKAFFVSPTNRLLVISTGWFLLGQILATAFSVDKTISILGYYGRFSGGLLSTISLLVVFWAVLLYLNSKHVFKLFTVILVGSMPVVAFGYLQKLGVDKDFWIQDPTARIFSTLGQPNWLATYLLALLPLIWFFAKLNKKWLLLLAASLPALYLTHSQSGTIALAVEILVYWFWGKITKTVYKIGVVVAVTLLVLGFTLIYLLPIRPTGQNIPTLLRAGSSSKEIRQIVWKGAVGTFLHHPLLGTGPETFALSYWQTRPLEQNLTSEWNFTYNKAHNEVLNFAANSGLVGVSGFLFLTAALGWILISSPSPITRATFSAFVGVNTANFFGFSTSTGSLLYFLLPALAILSSHAKTTKPTSKKAPRANFLAIASALAVAGGGVIFVCQFWLADYRYAQATKLQRSNQFLPALASINKSVSSFSSIPAYWDKRAEVQSQIALMYFETKDLQTAQNYGQAALTDMAKAQALSPHNVALSRNLAAVETKLSLLDPNMLTAAIATLQLATTQAPTDPSHYYHLGNLYFAQDKYQETVFYLEKAIQLKNDYKEARLTLAAVYEQMGQPKEALEQYQYLLVHIAPNDPFILNKVQTMVK